MSCCYKPVDNDDTLGDADTNGEFNNIAVGDDGICFSAAAPGPTCLKRDAATAAVVTEVDGSDILEVDTDEIR
jgi:hypothetical protein